MSFTTQKMRQCCSHSSQITGASAKDQYKRLVQILGIEIAGGGRDGPFNIQCASYSRGDSILGKWDAMNVSKTCNRYIVPDSGNDCTFDITGDDELIFESKDCVRGETNSESISALVPMNRRIGTLRRTGGDQITPTKLSIGMN